MRRLSSAVILSCLALAGPLSAQTTITFNDGRAGVAIGGFYSGLGVTFVNARWDAFISPGEGDVGAGGLKFIHLTSGYAPKASDPIIADFSSGLSFVSVRALNVGEHGARIDALDGSGNLLGFAQAVGVGQGIDNHPLLQISAANIRRLRLYQPLPGMNEGMVWDNLTVQSTTVVPEPSTTALLTAGVLGLLVVTKGRRNHHQRAACFCTSTSRCA
jgi:hypothetical protein